MRTTNENGVALLVTLFLMAALSALAASLMFLSQTETYSTMNYQMMSQARYAGESGVERTVNYLLDPTQYPTPGGASDPTTNYDMTKYPVACTAGCTTHTGTCSFTAGAAPSGACVVLSAMTGVASNYPVSLTTAFSTAGSGTLTSGASSIGYSTYAVLMSMQTIGSSSVQTWTIVSDGTVTGARTAKVEVISTLETPLVGMTGNSYAAFATSSACGAITFSGSAATNAFDSSKLAGAAGATNAFWSGGKVGSGHPVTNTTADANVGTNGNLTESGAGTVNGHLYTPRTGVGTCNNGGDGSAGDAETQSGSATVTKGLVKLGSAWVPPTPSAPSPLPGTATNTMDRNHPCKDGTGATMPNCSTSATPVATFSGGSSVGSATLMGNLTISSDYVMHLGAGYYTFNSLSVSGAAQIIIDSGPVIINIAGTGITSTGSAINISGGGLANSSYIPTNLMINYAGSGKISISGGTSTAAYVNAPNSAVTLSGGGDLYGAVLSQTLTDSGGTSLHYDTQMSSMYSSSTTGTPLLTSFSWKKY